MPSLKASPEGLQRIQQARNERGLAIHNIQWLIEASKILQPHKNWATREENGRLAVSIGTWKRFLAGEAIRPAQFKAFCQVLAIDWQDVIHKAPKNATYGAKNDWGEAPDSSAFISRTAEIATLQQWIIGEKVRLVPILGSGGIGKTSLATKVAREIAEDFDSVIWRSLREAPPLEKILSDCIKLFSEHQSIDLPNTLEEQITALLDLLCSHRCLMVFDNLEALLQSGSTKGDYQPQFTGYSQLFRRIGESSHQPRTTPRNPPPPRSHHPRPQFTAHRTGSLSQPNPHRQRRHRHRYRNTVAHRSLPRPSPRPRTRRRHDYSHLPKQHHRIL
jgi:hypothetical protein